MYRFFGLLLVLGLIFGTISVASAQDGGEIVVGTPFKGTASGQPVTHTFTATAGQLLLINVMSDEFDARMSIRDSSGVEISYDDDSGDEYNALLAFLVPADATYQLVVDSWSDASGSYSITIDVIQPTPITAGETVSLAPNGKQPLYATFSATTNQVVNLYAMSPSGDDTKLTVYNTASQIIAEDDDSGIDQNPYLRRIVLPTEGLYLVQVTSLFDEALTGSVDLTLEATESLMLSETPQEFTLGNATVSKEVLTFEVEAGRTYRLNVVILGGTGVSLRTESSDFNAPTLDASSGSNITWDFTATTTGTMRLSIAPSFFSEGDTFQVSLQVVR
jgi:hypothetical protein